MRIRVFVQNEAGSRQKNRHNEKTLVWLYSDVVSHPYPFPYGFIVGTSAADSDSVDCFVVTRRELLPNQIVECEPIGLMRRCTTPQGSGLRWSVLPGFGVAPKRLGRIWSVL